MTDKTDAGLLELADEWDRYVISDWDEKLHDRIHRTIAALRATPAQCDAGDREAIAQLLWRHFAPTHHIEWKDETHKAEYLMCADMILTISSPQPSAAGSDAIHAAGTPTFLKMTACTCRSLGYKEEHQQGCALACAKNDDSYFFPPGDVLPPPPPSMEMREELKKAREEIVLGISFLSRDQNSPRLSKTVEGLIERFAAADKEILRALSPEEKK